MKRAISYLFALLAITSLGAGINNAMAQELTFATGQPLTHMLSVCMDKQDALDILNAHKSGGKDAAEKVWQSRDKCGNGHVVGAKVGKVVHSVKIEGGVFSAVEIVFNGEVVGYFLTSAPINKPQRNT